MGDNFLEHLKRPAVAGAKPTVVGFPWNTKKYRIEKHHITVDPVQNGAGILTPPSINIE